MHARWHGTRPGPYPGAGAGPCRTRAEMIRLAIDHHHYHTSQTPINVIDRSFPAGETSPASAGSRRKIAWARDYVDSTVDASLRLWHDQMLVKQSRAAASAAHGEVVHAEHD